MIPVVPGTVSATLTLTTDPVAVTFVVPVLAVDGSAVLYSPGNGGMPAELSEVDRPGGVTVLIHAAEEPAEVVAKALRLHAQWNRFVVWQMTGCTADDVLVIPRTLTDAQAKDVEQREMFAAVADNAADDLADGVVPDGWSSLVSVRERWASAGQGFAPPAAQSEARRLSQ